jgi:hypothetical protein
LARLSGLGLPILFCFSARMFVRDHREEACQSGSGKYAVKAPAPEDSHQPKVPSFGRTLVANGPLGPYAIRSESASDLVGLPGFEPGTS